MTSMTCRVCSSNSVWKQAAVCAQLPHCGHGLDENLLYENDFKSTWWRTDVSWFMMWYHMISYHVSSASSVAELCGTMLKLTRCIYIDIVWWRNTVNWRIVRLRAFLIIIRLQMCWIYQARSKASRWGRCHRGAFALWSVQFIINVNNSYSFI